MIKEFNNLQDDEIDVLLKAPLYVSILIAGADGKIDEAERKKAIEIAHFKQSKAREKLTAYFELVADDFQEQLNALVMELPDDSETRSALLTTELAKLNEVFPKIEPHFAVQLYASLKDLAKKISESSGGIFGYLATSYEELQLVSLKMIKDPSVD